MASTSAVNVDEAGQDFGGEDYDESYDGYYEDDGAEMGDGAEGNDGTKGSDSFDDENYQFLEDFRDEQGNRVVKCLLCGKSGNLRHNMRRHMRNSHSKPNHNNICQYCQKLFKNSYSLNRHIAYRRCSMMYNHNPNYNPTK